MISQARELAALSASEMVAALGAGHAPALLRRGLTLPFLAASRTLGRKLARFDVDVAAHGLPGAAQRALRAFDITLTTSGSIGAGPHLVLANHPGAWDALALMSALGRRDLRILAADRRFLRALPQVAAHLCFVGDDAGARAGALKRAVSQLRAGGVLLHFPAGRIEPDADFEPDGSRLLLDWQPGVGTLVRACLRQHGRVVVAGVRGVHSPRAKRWLVNRLAERRGITTLSPLLQIVGGLKDVVTRVRLEEVTLAGNLDADSLHDALRARLRAAILGA